MKLKEKFDSIDQSKLNADQKDFLSKIEKATKNFTSDNKEVNDKVEGALDKMIATFKEKMPEAIKTKAEKKEPKATAKKTSTKATAKPSQTSNPKRTVMSVAKEIRKDGESWADAQKRARAEMKKDKDSATKEVKTEMNKLLAFIKTRKELDGISGTDLKRDSVREAKPRGRRISKDGNVYYENRENRIDRLSPNYPKDAPMLAGGGDIGKKLYYERMNVGKAKYTVNYHDGVKTHKDGSAFYDIAIFKNKKDLQDFISKLSKEGYKERSYFYAKGGMLSPRERYILEIQGLTNLRVGAIETYIYDNNLDEDEILNIVIGLGRKQIKATDMVTAVVGKPNNSESKKIISFAKSNEALKMELGGNTNKYKVGQKFYDTRYDRVSEIVPSSNDALITFVRFNKSGTEMDMSTKQSLVKSQFDYLVNMGAYQIRNYELGGTVVTDLAGHTGGGDGALNANMPLSGITGTQYSGLVGETGAMSSGEMFENGGGVDFSVGQSVMYEPTKSNKLDKSVKNQFNKFANRELIIEKIESDKPYNLAKAYDKETGEKISGYLVLNKRYIKKFENGGGVGEDYYEQLEVYVQGDGTIYSGTSMKKAIQSAEMYLMKNPDAEIAIVDIKYGDEYDMNGDLIDEYRKGGALTNDRRHVNYRQKYEVRYAKANPNKKRHGYGNLKFYDGGEFQTNIYAEGGGIEKMRTLSFKSKEIAEKNRKELVDYFGDRILNSSISKGIDERGNDGFYVEYDLIKQKYSNGGSLENHGIKEGDTFVKTISGGIQKVKDKDGKIVFINLATGERDSQPPLPFNEGGKVQKTLYSLDQIDYNIEYKDKDGAEYSESFETKDQALNEIFKLKKLGYIVTSRTRQFKDDGTYNGTFDDGGKVPEFIVNKDGIRVSKMVEPKKKLTEKEWMAKNNESKEARAYAGGGKIKEVGNKIIVTDTNNNEYVYGGNGLNKLGYLVPYIDINGRTKKYWEHHFIPKETWINIDEIKDFSIYPISKSDFKKLAEDSEEEKEEILLKFKSSFFNGGKIQYFVNKDGIRVSKMVEPKKKLTEKEWMSKYSESKEARAYADGGEIYAIAENMTDAEYNKNYNNLTEYKKNKVQRLIGLGDTPKLALATVLFGNFEIDSNSDTFKLYSMAKGGKLSFSEKSRAYAEGGDIEAFSMRMVKGSSASPTEVITEEKEVKFAKGGSLREKRNDYLSKLSDKEADVWDKVGANSGTKIRGDKKMLKAYAEGVEEMLIEENVQGRSFDQEDYDFYTDQNSHLFNEFLVWNGYYKPEMTVVEKKWREKAFKEGNIYVSDPEVITVKGVSSSENKSKNYILNSDIKSVTVNQKGMKYTFKGSDVLNGANILEKGNVLETKAIYIPKRDVISVELKDGSQVKPSNGYWIKKDASGEIFKTETEKAEKGGEIEDVLKNAKNASKKHGYDYYVYSDKKGEISLARKSEFERLFDKDDLKIIYKVDGDKATKLVAKAEKGAVVKRKSGNPKMKEAMVLAKKIRKDGEKWTDAVKRAYSQVK